MQLIKSKMKFSKFLFALVLFFVSFNVSFAGIAFMGIDIGDKTEFANSEELDLKSYIVNRDNDVKADMVLNVELKRIDDVSLFYKESFDFSFAPNEAKLFEHKIDLSSVPAGEYFLILDLKSPASTPIASLREEIVVGDLSEANSVIFSSLPYLKIKYLQKDGIVKTEYSYGGTGKPIVPESDFEVRFGLDSNEGQDVDVKFFLKDTYSQDEQEEVFSESVSLNSGVTNFSYDLAVEKSGTYELFVKVFDKNGIVLANKDIRVVIMGGDLNIVDVRNKQDIYRQGEKMELEVSYVGPADAMSVVRDSVLDVEVLVDGNVVNSDSFTIVEAPFSLTKQVFTFNVSSALEYYKVRVVISKDGKIFDELILDYEPLNPQLIISSDGRIYDPSVLACFDDGVCSNTEKTIGNCLDCYNLDKEENLVNEDNLNESQESQGEDTPVVVEDNSNNTTFAILGLLLFAIVVFLIYRGFKE